MRKGSRKKIVVDFLQCLQLDGVFCIRYFNVWNCSNAF